MKIGRLSGMPTSNKCGDCRWFKRCPGDGANNGLCGLEHGEQREQIGISITHTEEGNSRDCFECHSKIEECTEPRGPNSKLTLHDPIDVSEALKEKFRQEGRAEVFDVIKRYSHYCDKQVLGATEKEWQHGKLVTKKSGNDE